MPGEPLVCVWEAANAILADGNSPVLTVALLKEVTSSFKELCSVDYSETKFDAALSGHEVRFTEYKSYVHTVLRRAHEPLLSLLKQIEKKCWNICYGHYITNTIPDDLVEMLWSIFIRYADENSFPVVISKDRTLIFLNNLSNKLGLKMKKIKFPMENGVTFSMLLNIMEAVIVHRVENETLHSVVRSIYDKLTKKIIKSGWMFKRSKNKSNWTGWTKRWFVLTPGKLSYYVKGYCADPDGNSHKGDILITPETRLQSLPPYNGAFRRYSARFQTTNPEIQQEIEMSVDNETERKFWLEGIREVMVDEKTPTMIKEAHDAFRNDGKIASNTANSSQPEVITLETVPKIEVREADIDGNTNIVCLEEEKLKVIFMKIDKDKNGFIDEKELNEFLKCIGLQMSEEETLQIFRSIDTNHSKTISFEEFVKYFERVMFQENCEDVTENRLRSAFVSADQDGSGTINFKEFVEYIWEKKRSVRVSKLIKTFQNLEKSSSGEMPYDHFRQCIEQDVGYLEIIQEENEAENDASPYNLKSLLKNLYEDTDSEELALFIRDRWQAFASFKREGASGNIVMTGSSGMVADFTPGDYSLMDLACFSDIPPIEPRHTVIKGVKWISGTEAGKSGKCVFPPYFDGKVVSDIATNETLRYYGCSFANGNQVKISLLYRHGIQDFSYENQYLDDYVQNQNGGSGLEKHEFSHLDCPMVDECGFFMLGKFHAKDELHLTAFRIPLRHTLYIPGGVIHSNDYLKGKWRTMLSDEANVDHVHLVQPKTKTTYKHFNFSFI